MKKKTTSKKKPDEKHKTEEDVMADKYEALTTEFISDMEAVGGSFEDFVEGLKHAASELRDRWSMAVAEQREQEKENSDDG